MFDGAYCTEEVIAWGIGEEEVRMDVTETYEMEDDGKIVQSHKKVEIKECELGLGMFALEMIEVGDVVQEYTGNIVKEERLDSVEERYKQEGILANTMVAVEGGAVDGTRVGGAARYANHSCDSNTVLEEKEYEKGSVSAILRATKKIEVGQAITVNYAFEDDDWYLNCKCGAVNCRKWMFLDL